MKFLIKKNKKPIIENSLQSLKPFKWDSLWAYHPSVIEKDGEYYCIYTGKSLRPGISHNIGIAVSSDLEKWKKLPSPILKLGNKGDWDDDFLAHAYIFKEEQKFYMLYDGSKKGKWLEEIGLAESKDLIHWKKCPKNPIFKIGTEWWENSHVSRCCVFKENDKYFLYYAGHDGQRERIGFATGKSLTSLKRYSKDPVLSLGKAGEWDGKSVSDPRVIKHKGVYYMFYTGLDKNKIERVGIALSRDLYSWKKYKDNPILDVSKNNWDKISAGRSGFLLVNGKIYIFYSGRKKLLYSIGLAELKIYD